nr:unnamed protein product [Trichobilharzia regenti]
MSTQQMQVATSSHISQPFQQTTKENCDPDNKLVIELQSLEGELHSFQEYMKSELKSLETLEAQLLSKGVTIFGTEKSTIDNGQLQFPLATDEEITLAALLNIRNLKNHS